MKPSSVDHPLRRPRQFGILVLLTVSCGHGAGPPPSSGGAATEPAGAGSASIQVGVDGARRFLDGIPRCQGVPVVISAHDAREQPEGTKVAVRGVLLHNPKWDCPPKGCAGKSTAGSGAPAACCNVCRTRWFVVDEKDAARPYMSRARLYPREAGQPDLLTLEAQDCDVAKVNAATPPKAVVITGTFQGPAGEGGGSQLLDDAHLCAP